MQALIALTKANAIVDHARKCSARDLQNAATRCFFVAFIFLRFNTGICLFVGASVLGLTVGCPAQATEVSFIPVCGTGATGLKPLDSAMTALIKRWQIPGASLAIAKKGRLVYSKGFGFADVSNRERVRPDSIFRIASISKSITAVAVLKLIEQDKLNLSDKVFDLIKDLQPCSGHELDERMKHVTVQQLLQCASGWESKHGDPLFGDELSKAATTCGVAAPPDRSAIIRYWIEKPLVFEPGTRFGYSNFAYTLLEELVDRCSGQPYDQFVEDNVLQPMGLLHIKPGATLKTLPGEVRYYPIAGETKFPNLLKNDGVLCPLEYGGGFVMERMTGAAGWTASAPDLVRFVSTLAGDCGTSCLSDSTFERMLARPPFLPSTEKGYFGMGWEVYETASGKMFSRIGGMSGTVAFVVHKPDGISWAVLYNCRTQNQSQLMTETKNVVWQAIQRCHHRELSERSDLTDLCVSREISRGH